MTEELSIVYNSLSDIKKYLIKKGKSRFTGNIAENKLIECEKLVLDSDSIIKNIKIHEKPEIIAKATEIYYNINTLFALIKELCVKPETFSSKMDFDFKTACNLLPVMDGSEDTTKRLIDGIELYSDNVKDTDIPLLIKFVLKSRLSEQAKLRMSTQYSSVKDVVRDMKTHLLTKKSFTAIQARLQGANQGWRSIEEYGSEIETLFTDLTISQADGDTSSYNVLKPINEKLAIKKFSDGLKNPKLSTIIAARNYTSLKDAIQAAKDEEISFPSTSSSDDVMHVRNESAANRRGFRGRRNYFHNRFSNQRQFQSREFYNNNPFSRGKYHARGGQQKRGFSQHNRGQFSGGSTDRAAFAIAENDAEGQPTSQGDVNDDNSEKSQFFRD